MQNENTSQNSISEAEVQIDHYKLELLMQKKAEEQNLLFGIFAGIIASIIGASIWAGVTYVTEYQIGWMAVGVGFLVGYAVRFAGKGFDSIYGISGAVLSLIGCLLGNLLTVFLFIAGKNNISFLEVALNFNFSLVPQVMIETFEIMDILFYGIAVYEGYKFSINSLSEEDLGTVLK